jgi:hypothetical protein
LEKHLAMKKIKLRFSSIIVFVSFGVFLLGCKKNQSAEASISPEDDEGLNRVLYNNPSLIVDLGVGLWAWPLPMDFDNDGDMDLVVSCPDTPYNGTYFFENTSSEKMVMPVFKPAVRIGEGMKNLQVHGKDNKLRVTGRGSEYLNFREEIFSNEKGLPQAESIENNHQKIRFSQWKYVDYENDGDMDLLVGIDDWGDYGWDNAYDKRGNWTNGPLHGFVYLLENEGGTFGNPLKILAGGEPIDLYGAPSPNMEDFDGDGDLDLICGEFLDRLTWFENTGSRETPVFAEGRFLSNMDGMIKMDLEMIVPSAVDWDKDGDVDLVVGDEDGRVAFIENTGTVKNHMPMFKSPVYFQQEAEYVKFGALATPFSTDWDDDGDEDLIVGNSAGYIGFIENLDGGNPPKWASPIRLKSKGLEIRYLAGENGSIQGPAESKWGYTALSVADWDGDGLKDIIVNSIWGKIMWHKNIGSKGNPKLSEAKAIMMDWNSEPVPKPIWNWWDPGPTELVTQWRTTPFTVDWNNDGLIDLVMLDHEGYLAFFERFRDSEGLKLKSGRRIFYGVNGSEYTNKNKLVNSLPGPLRLNSGINGASGRRKIALVDWDLDGDLDLLVNGINAVLFENTGKEDGKVLMSYKGDISDRKLAGHTTSPTIVDWDNNGVPDVLLGAEDGFFYHMINYNE